LVAGFAGYAVLSNSAAGKAEDKLAELETTKQELAATALPLKKLLADETAIKASASGYVAIKDAQDCWPGVLTDLRKHFTSEFTWVTDLEPLANYDPTKPNEGKVKNGDSVVKDDFGTDYGSSQLNTIKVEAPAPPAFGPKPKPGQVVAAPAPAVPMANAIRIKGLWRDNDAKQNVVNKLVKALRDSNSAYLSFSIKGADGKEVPLKDEQVVKSLKAIAEAEEEFAWPFEIVIPLAQPMPTR
jgi:hypothetical protein